MAPKPNLGTKITIIPPYPPLEKEGEQACLKSPSIKGGFRGIAKMISF
jgi:hypothetical protein